jgi:hypothetical protein
MPSKNPVFTNLIKRIDKVFSKLWHKAKCLRLKNFGGDKSTNKKMVLERSKPRSF